MFCYATKHSFYWEFLFYWKENHLKVFFFWFERKKHVETIYTKIRHFVPSPNFQNIFSPFWPRTVFDVLSECHFRQYCCSPNRYFFNEGFVTWSVIPFTTPCVFMSFKTGFFLSNNFLFLPKSVPGKQSCQKSAGVKHQRWHRVEKVHKRKIKSLAVLKCFEYSFLDCVNIL